ncbi:MAG: hypothetical protein KDA54_16075 [Phycisphaerales bacterium]|nr:hypothetical protein [Phycisphaerales bacterium]
MPRNHSRLQWTLSGASPDLDEKIHWVAVFLSFIVACVLFWPIWALVTIVTFAVSDALGYRSFSVDAVFWIALLFAFPAAIFIWRFAYGFFKRQRETRGGCLNCGYNLTGNTSGVCPECGTPAVNRVDSAGGDSV